jgi:hypothetical protein
MTNFNLVLSLVEEFLAWFGARFAEIRPGFLFEIVTFRFRPFVKSPKPFNNHNQRHQGDF